MSGAHAGIEAELITDPTAIDEIEDVWRALAELRGNAFITPEWFRAWAQNRPPETSPTIAVARHRDGRLAGVLPLTLDFGHRPRMLTFPAAHFGDRFGPAARVEDEAAVAAAAMRALADAGLDRYTLTLNNVEPDASWWRSVKRASASDRAGILQQRGEQPYIDLAGLDDWDSYLASRSRKFRGNLRQGDRKLEDGRDVDVRTADEESLQADLNLYFDLHERRWEERSAILSPIARAFLTSFAELAQRQGWLRLRVLELDGEPAAAFFGWRIGDRFAYYNGGFDPAMADLGVGTVLLARTVRRAIEEGATEFDMLLGGEAYKKRFCNASRDVQTVVLPKALAPARLLISAEAGARTIGRRFGHRRGGRALRRLLPTTRSH